MLAIDEVIDHATLNRPRPIECVQRGKVFDGVRLVPPQDIAHTVRFKLEYARRQPLVENFVVGLIVLKRQSRQFQLLPTGLRNQLDGVIENRQRGKPEKIHLQKAELLDRDHVERGYDFIVLRLVQWHQFRQWTGRNDHAGSMHARVPDQSLQLFSGLEQFTNLR